MRPCSYSRTPEPHQAIASVANDPGAAFVAGGTTLLDLMKLEVMRPTSLVDINPLPWKQVEKLPHGGVLIGSMVTNSELAWHPLIEKGYPVLSQALLSGASPQLRNMATTGGNLLQRTRCPYFRDTALPCNKREPGTGCGALDGYNRMHAILGASDHCIAAHPSDMAVAMTALEAVLHLEGPGGRRTVPIGEFYLLPGDTPQRENVLQHGELIRGVELPPPTGHRSHYLKVRDRASFEFALVSVAAILDPNRQHSRLALGGVGTVPWRARGAEKALASGASFEQAAQAALEGARPRQYNTFKVELARRAIVRALHTVAAS